MFKVESQLNPWKKQKKKKDEIVFGLGVHDSSQQERIWNAEMWMLLEDFLDVTQPGWQLY